MEGMRGSNLQGSNMTGKQTASLSPKTGDPKASQRVKKMISTQGWKLQDGHNIRMIFRKGWWTFFMVLLMFNII